MLKLFPLMLAEGVEDQADPWDPVTDMHMASPDTFSATGTKAKGSYTECQLLVSLTYSIQLHTTSLTQQAQQQGTVVLEKAQMLVTSVNAEHSKPLSY